MTQKNAQNDEERKLVEELRATWRGRALAVCLALSETATGLKFEYAGLDDLHVDNLIKGIAHSVLSLNMMVDLMSGTVNPPPNFDREMFGRVQAKWREDVAQYYADLVGDIDQIHKIVRASSFKADKIVRMETLADELGDMLTLKYYLNGDLKRHGSQS